MDLEALQRNINLLRAHTVCRVLRERRVVADFEEVRRLCEHMSLDQVANRMSRWSRVLDNWRRFLKFWRRGK